MDSDPLIVLDPSKVNEILATYKCKDYLIGINKNQFKGLTVSEAKDRIKTFPNGNKIHVDVYDNTDPDSGYELELYMENTIRLLRNPVTDIIVDACLG